MNAKSKLLVKYAEGVIEMNTTFAKEMRNPLSEEYALLQRTRLDFPTFAVRTRKINTNPKKDTYKGLTYEWMRNHIATHEPKNIVEQKLAEFNDLIALDKKNKVEGAEHLEAAGYLDVKKWFLAKFPEIKQYKEQHAEKVQRILAAA